MPKAIDITGERFGHLIAIRPVGHKAFPSGQRKKLWEFSCDCGNTVTTTAGQVRSGMTKSCGCAREDMIAAARTKHGFASHRKTGKLDPTYLTWRNMKNRCLNPKSARYGAYGGRGITVCDAWLTFENFFADMGEKPDGMSLDRIDVNAGYSKENCRWVKLSEQHKNKQQTLTVAHNGETMCLKDWSRRTGIAYSCLYARFKNGDRGDVLFR